MTPTNVHQVSASELEPGDTILIGSEWHQLVRVVDRDTGIHFSTISGMAGVLSAFDLVTVQ